MKKLRRHSQFFLLMALIYLVLPIHGTHIHSLCQGEGGSGVAIHQHGHQSERRYLGHDHADALLKECCSEVSHTHVISVPHLWKKSHDYLTSVLRPSEVVFFKNFFQRSITPASFRFGSAFSSGYFPEVTILRI